MEKADVLEYLRILGWESGGMKIIDGESFVNKDGRQFAFGLHNGNIYTTCSTYPIQNNVLKNIEVASLSFEEQYLFMQYIYMTRPDICGKVFNKYRES